MPSKQTICLVLGCDDGFVVPLAVALYSALRHLDSDQNVDVYIIDGGISAAHKQRIEQVAHRVQPNLTVSWIVPVQKALEGLEGARHLSIATYLRLFIPDLVPSEVTRAIYLDCDALVTGNLAELWRKDLAGALIGAVPEFAVLEISHPFSGIKDFEELGLDPNAMCFNAGILLMDIAQWRQKNTAAKALSYAVKHGAALVNCDQDAMNATMIGQWQPLDYTWNVQSSLLYLHESTQTDYTRQLAVLRPDLVREANIVHFSGSSKPWQHWCGHPATDAWANALLASGWFTPKEAVGWAAKYWPKRILFKLKVALRLLSLRERVN